MRAQVLRDLLKLPVVTQSGTVLGRIADVEIEPDSVTVIAYLVSPSFVKGLFANEQYVIRPSQVVSISNEKMVVKDGSVTEPQPPTSVLKKMAWPHTPAPITQEE